MRALTSTLAGLAALSVLAVAPATAGAAPDSAAGGVAPAAHAALASPAATKVMWVGIDGARLRSSPTTRVNNVIDSANAGNGFTADCEAVEGGGQVGWLFVHGTLWGGQTGWMRIDMFAGRNPDDGIHLC
ncbi:hypothetical protein [Amycolatopsis benzoatilytica]|uniref:hypothetical protein n=1 Tax=Amycolatopsis benzoatilytica TaxID=346045 RepID=UPI000380C4AB|nr:hypothetical protein [Amycolatopsis benzoatilytica]